MTKQLSAKRFLSESNFQWLIVICCLLIFIGFVCSRVIATIGMALLFFISFFEVSETLRARLKKADESIAPGALTRQLIAVMQKIGFSFSVKNFWRRKELLVLTIYFWIVFFSGFYSEDKESWLNWVRIKLPYIFLPVAFSCIKKLEERKFIALFYGFVVTLSISVVFVLANYFSNYNTITESFLRGNTIPMPYSHIRYTLMVAFAFFCCWFLLEKKYFLFNANEQWLQIFLLVFLFVALHILSVRSSLLALYVGIIFLLLRFIFVQKRFFLGTVALLMLVTVSFSAYKFIPSLKNKIAYMKYDYNSFKSGEVRNLSDGARLLSMQGGLEVAKQNLWMGVGAGDLKAEMNKFYSEHYPQLEARDHKLPHNQLIWTLATTGLIGLALFLFAFAFPLLANFGYKNWLLVVLHLILFSSFFTEATLEEQIGTGFYLIFLLVLTNQFRNE